MAAAFAFRPALKGRSGSLTARRSCSPIISVTAWGLAWGIARRMPSSLRSETPDRFDEEAVEEHLHGSAAPPPAAASCPSARVASPDRPAAACRNGAGRRAAALRQWPVQMRLVSPTAHFLHQADLLLSADCVAFAHADFHRDFLQGRALLIGCPKLDDGRAYLEKLTAILMHNDIRSLTVLHMEVPCCSGLIQIARQAITASGRKVPLETVQVGIEGEMK